MKDLFIPRYSPKPIEGYSAKVANAWVGPAYSVFLANDAHAWNLAWLSHPFEKQPQPSDASFTTMVRRSTESLRKQLERTPEGFWRASMNGLLLKATPLYAVGGDDWLSLVRERALEPWTPAEHQANLNVGEAARILKKIFNAHI